MPRRSKSPKPTPKPVQVLYRRPRIVVDEDGMRCVRLSTSSEAEPDAYRRQLKKTAKRVRRTLALRYRAEQELDASIKRAERVLHGLLDSEEA